MNSESSFSNSRLASVELESDAFETSDLVVYRLDGEERISAPYRFEVMLVHRKRGPQASLVDPMDMLGASVRLRFVDEARSILRTVHGIVAEAALRAEGDHDGHPSYELSIAPSLHRATLVSTQEIFMGSSVVEIIESKLERNDLEDYATFATTAQYPAREFVVQYGETDLAFISRLAEHVGLSFYFDQRGGAREALVFTDFNAGFAGSAETKILYARGHSSGISDLVRRARMSPALYAVNDYNYRHPQLDLLATHTLDERGTSGGFVEYGSHHKTPAEGEALATIRAEEEACRRAVYEGKSFLVGLAAGVRFAVDEHPAYAGKELLVVSVTHRISASVDAAALSSGGMPLLTYENAFVATSTEHTYRPPRTTPRPRIHGFVTGIVQGRAGSPAGGFADLDDQGRYTVTFSFDTADVGTAKASRPVRMAQPFAGPNQGMHFPLRPGTEVLLGFADGDPDRPVILGAVPNSITASPTDVRSPNKNRIQLGSGILFEISDGK